MLSRSIILTAALALGDSRNKKEELRDAVGTGTGIVREGRTLV
jgi:hypothetical protein